ncbi:MAG TPA: Arc family DNA-binding protein [Cryptosporangiaceae bacterium]|nr:Arc family DNA-binding protein [Cryptosporangiaceae bacterium]
MSFVLRLPDELEERVRSRAQAEHRSLHSLVIQAVERYVTETVSDADFERALAEVGPYAQDVFAWHDNADRAKRGAGE